MKQTLPFVLLLIVALGCNKFGSSSSSTSNTSNHSNANAASPKIAKIIDLPATIGKSKDEIKKMISATPTHEDPWLEYSLPEADLTFKFKKGKADQATFSFKSISIGDASISGMETAEQLGTMAGVDIKGKTPKSKTVLADTYEFEIGGKKIEANFYKVQEKFSSVFLQVD